MDIAYSKKIIVYILKGASFTCRFGFVTFICSVIIATLLVFIFNTYKNSLVNGIISIVARAVRGTPLLFQIYFIYFGIPIFTNLKITNIQAAYISYITSWTLYLFVIIKGGVDSVKKGQYDAAAVLGLSNFQTMTRIILPQGIVSVLPSIGSQAVSLIYGTALLSTIGINDLLNSARISVIRDLRLEGFLIAAIIYFILNGMVLGIFNRIEILLRGKRYGK